MDGWRGKGKQLVLQTHTHKHSLACLRSYSHVVPTHAHWLSFSHTHTRIHTGWREMEWECVLEGRPRPPSLQASVKKKKITPISIKPSAQRRKEEAFQFSLPPPLASSCPACLGLWETAWHTAYQQLSHSSLYHYSGEVQRATGLTLWRWCKKALLPRKHIAREIIMQHSASDKSDRNLETWSRDIKKQHFQFTATRHSRVNRADNHCKKPFTKAAIDVLMKVTFFLLARQSALSVNNAENTSRIINSTI